MYNRECTPPNPLSPLPLYLNVLQKTMPDQMILSALSVKNGLLVIGKHQVNIDKKINIIAYGKASRLMYAAARKIVGEDFFGKGMLITHEDLSQFTKSSETEQVFKSSHPFISELSLIAGKKVKSFVESGDSSDILLALISGGGSAMVAMPIKDVNFKDKISFISDLMHASVPEREVNVIKKALSQLKGGKLAQASNAKVIVNCILSDERNHEISAISSGMTVCNPIIDPIYIMDQYNLWDLPQKNIAEALRSHGKQKDIGCDKNIINSIIGSRENLIDGMVKVAHEYGFESVSIISNIDNCTPEEAVSTLSSNFEGLYKVAGIGKHLVISTGEVQVKADISKDIKGGRNQHLVALFMLKFSPLYDFFFTAIATDGVDYIEGVHGAFYESSMKSVIETNKSFIHSKTNNTDSYAVHKLLGSLLEGPKTGTNLSDFFLFSFHKT